MKGSCVTGTFPESVGMLLFMSRPEQVIALLLSVPTGRASRHLASGWNSTTAASPGYDGS